MEIFDNKIAKCCGRSPCLNTWDSEEGRSIHCKNCGNHTQSYWDRYMAYEEWEQLPKKENNMDKYVDEIGNTKADMIADNICGHAKENLQIKRNDADMANFADAVRKVLKQQIRKAQRDVLREIETHYKKVEKEYDDHVAEWGMDLKKVVRLEDLFNKINQLKEAKTSKKDNPQAVHDAVNKQTHEY